MTPVPSLRPSFCLLLALFCLIQISLAHASSSATLEAALVERLQTQSGARVYQWLAEQQPSQVEQADYYSWLGQIAMQLGKYEEAAGHLERAVLLEPRNLGLRLDLTIAYTQAHNIPAARASLRALHYHLNGGDVPPAAAARLAELERRLSPSYAERANGALSQASGSLSLAQGYDSNANLGARNNSLSLNLWGVIPYRAELAPDSLAQSSLYSRIDAMGQVPASAAFSGEQWHDWQLLAGGSLLHYHQLDDLHRRDLFLGGQWRPRPAAEQLNLFLLHQDLEGGEPLVSLVGDYRRMLAPQWMAGGSVRWRQEPAGKESTRWQLGLWHTWGESVVKGQVSWQFRPGRPAGDTWRAELGIDSPTWHWRGAELSAFALVEHREDTQPYSRQFFGNVRREETQAIMGGRLRYPIGNDLEAQLDARYEATQANLGLFENHRWAAEMQLNWRW